MTRRAPRDETGAAAVEMALVTVLFLAILGFVAPLGVILYENVQIGRDAADVVRFASSRPMTARTISDTTSACPSGGCVVHAGFLPTAAQIAQEATRGRTGTTIAGTTVSYSYDRTLPRTQAPVPPDPTCPSGRRVTVTLTNQIQLGVFGAFIPNGVQTVSARATSCEE